MTLNNINSCINAPLFDKNELSLIKLLVLESLSKYDDLNEANCRGNIYKLLTSIKSKVHELSNEL